MLCYAWEYFLVSLKLCSSLFIFNIMSVSQISLNLPPPPSPIMLPWGTVCLKKIKSFWKIKKNPDRPTLSKISYVTLNTHTFFFGLTMFFSDWWHNISVITPNIIVSLANYYIFILGCFIFPEFAFLNT